MDRREEWDRAWLFKPYRNQRYTPTDKIEEAVWEKVGAYIDGISEIGGRGQRWTRRSQSKGLLLMGRPGSGKTLLAHNVLEAALERGHSALAVRFSSYVKWHRVIMDSNAPSENRSEAYECTDLVEDTGFYGKHYLLLDDVGKEYTGATEWAPSLFRELMRERADVYLPTIVTTNLNEDEIVSTYGEPCWSHLNQFCVIVPTSETDHRVDASREFV